MRNARADAARSLLLLVAGGSSLNAVLTEAMSSMHKEIVYGVTRWYWKLDAIAGQFLRKRLRDKDADVMMLILIGLYQLSALRVPPHAAINETVSACEHLGKGWAKGLVNGVLRSYLRQERDRKLTPLPDAAQYSFPTWMLERIRDAWPDDWQEILAASNARPPMVIRVNRRRSNRADYMAELARAGMAAEIEPLAPDGLRINRPVPVRDLPGFADGIISVQDTAAQWAAPLLPVSANDRVLDACAAPGGKLTHILECYPEVGEVLAIDVESERASLIQGSLDRLGLAARVIAADAADLAAWWNGEQFDCVVVDAPCTGTGVIRRRPDIKHLRRRGDIAALAARQAALLQQLWQTLAPRGHLLYITCSVFPEENEQQVERFVSGRADVEVRATGLPTGLHGRCGTQTLPGVHGVDGFYYSLMRKR